jgi:hypothetical protein
MRQANRIIGQDLIRPAGYIHAVRVSHAKQRELKRNEVLCDRELRAHRFIEKTRITGTTLAGELA